MEIGFDNIDWLAPTAPRPFGGDGAGAPDWLELQARLGAAWSARQVLSADRAESPARAGSFDQACAHVLAGFEAGTWAVNPNALGNLKPHSGNAGQHAGDSTSGGRG